MNPAISGPNADLDGDGFNNQAEFIAGTDPQNAASKLKLNFTPTPTNALLEFDGVSNKSYTVQHRGNVSSGGWQKFTDYAALSSNALIHLPVPLTNRANFFRLTTPQLP